jgi:hypothetical protein
MPAICGNVVKELVHQTVSDVVVDGINGDFACLPSSRSELFSVPSNISLCSSRFIQGVLLGAGCDASFIGYCARMPILVTSVRPINTCDPADPSGAPGVTLGVDPCDLAQVLLLFQLLVAQTQVSLAVNERVQWCQFAYRLQAGGGVWGAIGASGADCAGGDASCPNPSGGYALLNNGWPSADECFNFRQPFALQTDQRISAIVDFDTVQASSGDCVNVLDLLANAGSSNCYNCGDTGCAFTSAQGIVVKADFAIDGILCKQVC